MKYAIETSVLMMNFHSGLDESSETKFVIFQKNDWSAFVPITCSIVEDGNQLFWRDSIREEFEI